MITDTTAPDPHATEPPVDGPFLNGILEVDVANIARKAQTGQPLTRREREIIEEERTKRGGNDASAGFNLEGEGAIPALERMTQKELAELWGYSLRQLKNWLREGRQANDPAPVTQPALMCAWFARNHAPREAPEKLRRAAARILEGHRVEDADSRQAKPVVPAALVEVQEEDKGLLAMLDRYRTAEVRLHKLYMAAVEAGNEVRAQFLLAEWSKMGDKARALEKQAPKALEEAGIYVRRAEIQRELEPLHAAIIKTFRQEFRMARVRLKAAANHEEWARVVDAVVNEIGKMLCETEFREPLELDVA